MLFLLTKRFLLEKGTQKTELRVCDASHLEYFVNIKYITILY
jgi:hypothetical protein